MLSSGGRLLVAMVVSSCLIHAAEWVNPLGGMLSRSCLYGFGISGLYSQFHRGKKDRQWEVNCSRVGEVPHGENCRWTAEFINGWQDPIHFTCNESTIGFEGYVSGLYSDHDNLSGDRTWRVECCTSNGITNDACVETDHANEYEQTLSFSVPPMKILHGIISQFDNNHGDRKWRFQLCDIREEEKMKSKKRKNTTRDKHNSPK